MMGGSDPEGRGGGVKTRPAPRLHRAPKEGGRAPVRLGDFRAGVASMASKAETEENTEDTWIRHCESQRPFM